MTKEQIKYSEREYPHTHLILILTPLIFSIIWLLDGFILEWSTWLNHYIPTLVRIILFMITLGVALTTIYISHKKLFTHDNPSNELITNGILKYSRNPLYFGILILYISLILLSISLISIVLFILIFLIYNKMVNFEEKILEEMFGEEYYKYKSDTSKWIPIPLK
ncbi:MAG: isoprenylcysteine carboxylmethyltransferase family protein [Candidatus Lokiarchaeota archaeon]|nr:isoprenylcysteine carboxylmethyltransferase family protein [Candidatus Lokiarchaeota archaeon]